MSSNKTIREELERLCGKGCFFKRAHIAERIEAMGGIKTYKVFISEKKFKRKKKELMTLHHLKHKSEGGATTIENGANVEETAHQYLHSLPREQEEVVNNMLREFKLNFGIISGTGEMEEAKSLEVSFGEFGEDYLEIDVFDCDEEVLAKRQRQMNNRKEKRQRLQNPTRAMKKRELQKIVEEEFDEEWEK